MYSPNTESQTPRWLTSALRLVALIIIPMMLVVAGCDDDELPAVAVAVAVATVATSR